MLRPSNYGASRPRRPLSPWLQEEDSQSDPEFLSITLKPSLAFNRFAVIPRSLIAEDDSVSFSIFQLGNMLALSQSHPGVMAHNSPTSMTAVDKLQVPTLHPRASVGNGIELRIYPLGDSITNGYQSTDNNGYRLPLQRNLAGSKVFFVGSKFSGTMDDNWNEGWNGFTIDQIAVKAKDSQHYLRPNIILLHAGTNDLNSAPPIDPDHAPDRLGALIDQLADISPEPVILVAQIINAKNAQTESLIQKYNEAIPRVVAQRAKTHKVAVVDMRSVQAADLADGLHPTDGGYRKMADLWFKAIQDAADKGWINVPNGPPIDLGAQGGHSNSHCLTSPNWVPALNNNPIATGVGRNGDMKFTANWIHKPDVASGIGKVGTGVVFADLNGDGRADYLFVNRTSGSVILYLNTGVNDEITWAPANDGMEIASGLAPRDLDIDLDGKDDYCVMGNATGSVTVWLNRGPKEGGWNWDGPHEVAPGGRPDYLVKNSNGGIDAYLNIGKPKTIEGIKWIGAGHIAAGLGTDDISIADINGDGRADYLLWSQTGGLTGYLNYRTEKEGQPGWASTGETGSIAGGLGKSSAYCRLADLNGDGKVDYAIIGDKGEVNLYLNKGSADASVIGDGVRLADLNGDGIDDYIWLAPNAGVTLYINGGQQSDGQNWIWVPFNDGKEIANGAGAKREEILFADLDGDGKEDFVIVDPKSGGLTLYKSGGEQASNVWGWMPTGQIASGIGGPGSAVRLADMDGKHPRIGDGKADYMLLDPNGAVTLYLNKGEKPGGWNWIPANNGDAIATGIGFTREHVQFKDIDGDNLADYIGIDPLDGSTVVYKNFGPKSDGWGWAPMNDGKPIATGIGSVGADVIWGRLEKTNRYSYVGVSPNTGALRAYLNGCNHLSPTTGSSGSGGSGGSSTGSGGSSGSGSSSSDSGSGSGSGSGSDSGSGDGTVGSGSGSSGSDNGDNDASGNGSGSGANDPNDDFGIYFNGGLPIPEGGLSGLGLATTGIAALVGLTPYAISAQNALTSAYEAVNGLTAGTPTSAGVSAAVDALTAAASDLNAVSEQANDIDTTSFDPDTAASIEQQQDALESASQSVSDLIPRLQECESTPTDCQAVYSEASATLSGDSVVEPVEFFGSKGSDPECTGCGNGDSDSSSSGGSGGSGGSTPTGGGLPFPEGGLGLLGLPLAGAAAINSLKPYAITTRNAVGAASNLLNGLLGGSSSADFATAADALSSAVSDFSALSAQADAFELTSFTEIQVAEVQAEQAALRSASENLAQLLPKIRGCISNPGPCQTVVTAGLPLLAASNVIGSLVYITSFNGFGTKPTQTSNPASPAAAATSTATPLSWLLNTRSGTSIAAFKAFIQTLPDRGIGKQIVFEKLSCQWYVGRMTLEEALAVHQFPIVDQMVPNDPVQATPHFRPADTAGQPLIPRDDLISIVEYHESPAELGWLSWPRTKSIREFGPNDAQSSYRLEVSEGQGTYVYLIDGKVRWDHVELRRVSHEEHVLLGKAGAQPTDVNGHGSHMASSIAGNLRGSGVAKRTTIVSVVFTRGEADPSPPGLEPDFISEAWAWAISDIVAKGRKGKAVIVMAYGFDPTEVFKTVPNPDTRYTRHSLAIPTYDDFFLPLLAEAWDNDIPTVIGAPNYRDCTLGAVTPHRHGTLFNPLITVGALQSDGRIWGDGNSGGLGTCPEGPFGNGWDPSLTGAFSLYTFAVNIIVPDASTQMRGDFASGCSFAAAHVSGLIAYFMGLPAPHTLPMGPPGTFALQTKQTVVGLRRAARLGSTDAYGQAYNDVYAFITCGRRPAQKRSIEFGLNQTALCLEEIKDRYWEVVGPELEKVSGLT
ncbi:MAG: hypothetical protein Q9216_001557 [Gyalolechia sp. 2 TL-2023]